MSMVGVEPNHARQITARIDSNAHVNAKRYARKIGGFKAHLRVDDVEVTVPAKTALPHVAVDLPSGFP